MSEVCKGPEAPSDQENTEERRQHLMQEVDLKVLQERSFCEEYGNEFAILFKNRLFENDELLSPDCELKPDVRLLHYFLRNGRVKTLENAEKLGCKHHETLMTEKHPLALLFADAGIDIEGKRIDWIEVPEGKSGGMSRNGSKYGGEDELIMKVEGYTSALDDWCELPAQKAGYTVDDRQEWNGTVSNEMSHEILHSYFEELFRGKPHERLDEPFKKFYIRNS